MDDSGSGIIFSHAVTARGGGKQERLESGERVVVTCAIAIPRKIVEAVPENRKAVRRMFLVFKS